MTSIGAFQAKTHLSELLDRVEKGETIQILRHGKAVAKLVPDHEEDQWMKARSAVARLRKLRKGVMLGKRLTLKQLVEEGRA